MYLKCNDFLVHGSKHAALNRVLEFCRTYLSLHHLNWCPLNVLYKIQNGLLGGLSLHLNHLIASCMANYDWPFGTLPFGLFWSNLDTRDLETYPRTYSGHF